MPEDPDELRTGTSLDDDEGGPVKSFLEHLEDLRWVLIKSLVALGLAFLICLIADDKVVSILTYPLRQAKLNYSKNEQVVTFVFGTNRLGVFRMAPARQEFLNLGTNQFVTFHVEPVPFGDGTNQFVLGMRRDFDSTEAQRLVIPIVSLTPAGAFLVAVQVAMYGGALLSAPFILYFVACFVFPALKFKERKYIYRGLFYALGLFVTGVSFCYFVLLPIALAASVKYTLWMGFSVPQWTAEGFISFVCKFMLGMGLGFEMPVILLVLVKIGVLNYSILSKARRYVIIINFVLGSILTTPEVITQILMALPLQVLFEISVWIAWYWERKDKKRKAAEEAAEAARGKSP
jgi:sec-independent protein translocase protein TatC